MEYLHKEAVYVKIRRPNLGVTAQKDSLCEDIYWWVTSEERELRKALMIGEEEPDFTLEDVDGVERSSSDYQGQTVV